MLRCLIADDEAPARSRLRRLLQPLEEAGRLSVVAEAADGVDLVLLDLLVDGRGRRGRRGGLRLLVLHRRVGDRRGRGAPSDMGQAAALNRIEALVPPKPKEFESVILRTDSTGASLLLKDVARVELGAKSYDTVSRYNGQPTTGLAISLATGANAIDTAKAVAVLAKVWPRREPASVTAATARSMVGPPAIAAILAA